MGAGSSPAGRSRTESLSGGVRSNMAVGNRKPKADKAKMHADATRSGKITAAKVRAAGESKTARYSAEFAAYLKRGSWSR